jgi:hypothetical protein
LGTKPVLQRNPVRIDCRSVLRLRPILAVVHGVWDGKRLLGFCRVTV